LGLTLPHLCACPKSAPGFPTSYVVVLFCFNELRREEIFRFVDIGGIVDHHCFNIFFMILMKLFFIFPLYPITNVSFDVTS
jgi:hypothetical protein